MNKYFMYQNKNPQVETNTRRYTFGWNGCYNSTLSKIREVNPDYKIFNIDKTS